MSEIIMYIFKMIPYIIIVIPIFIVIRFVVYKLKGIKKINFKREILMLIFFMFLIGLLSQALFSEFDFILNNGINLDINRINIVPFRVFAQTYRMVFINKDVSYFIINFLGNIIMFIPVGLLVPIIWKIKDRKVILTGFLISLFIEITQILLPRGTDIDDLILNTFGTILGLILYKIIKNVNMKGNKSWKRKNLKNY